MKADLSPAMVSLNIYKNSANKFGRKTSFKIENEIEDQDQSIPKLIGILTQVFCTFGPNLVILAWTGDELSYRQAQNGITFDYEVKFDLQGQSPPKTMGILTKVFNTYGPNLVILAWKGDELSCGQASDYRTHGRTDGRTHRQTQATTIPEGRNWPRVKMRLKVSSVIWRPFCLGLNVLRLSKLKLMCWHYAFHGWTDGWAWEYHWIGKVANNDGWKNGGQHGHRESRIPSDYNGLWK